MSVTRLSCNSYRITNDTEASLFIRVFEVSVENMDDSNVPITFILGDADNFLELAVDETEDFEFDHDGAYVLQQNTVDSETGATSTIYHSYCNIRDCYQNILINVICKEACCDECGEKDLYNLNKFTALYHAYFSYVDVEYKYTDTINGALTDAKVQELFNIQLIRERIERLCEILADCGCTENLNNVGDCGCS